MEPSRTPRSRCWHPHYIRVHASSERDGVSPKITQHTQCEETLVTLGLIFKGLPPLGGSRLEAALCEGVCMWPGTAISTRTTVLLTLASWPRGHVVAALAALGAWPTFLEGPVTWGGWQAL